MSMSIEVGIGVREGVWVAVVVVVGVGAGVRVVEPITREPRTHEPLPQLGEFLFAVEE